MEKFQIVKQANINGLVCDFYTDGNGNYFMTRQQIGQALEYENPMIAISKIHERHKGRFEKYSVLTKLTSTDGKKYETYLYSAKGVYEICRWSRQPKADAFYDQVYDILEGLRLGYFKLEYNMKTPLWQDIRQLTKEIRKKETAAIKSLVDYAKAAGSKNADRYYTSLSILADRAAGIQPKQRDSTDIEHLTRLYMVENIIDQCIQAGIGRGEPYKDIYQACRMKIEQFGNLAYLHA